jgi:hypothetical protein
MNCTELVVHKLAIPESFLQEYADTIQERLLGAAGELVKGAQRSLAADQATPSTFIHSDVLGINRALHLANSVLLLGTSPENLRRTMGELAGHHAFVGYDLTTVLTVAVLYFLIERARLTAAAVDTSVDEQLRTIQKRFDRLHWMIEQRGMDALEMRATR